MCSWIIIHGRFFFFTVSFDRVLCYNIKLTDYTILIAVSEGNEPGIACTIKLINHNRLQRSNA